MVEHPRHALRRDAGRHHDRRGKTQKKFRQMNRKQFLILLALLAVIGAAGWMVHQRNNQSWQNADAAIGQKLLSNLAVNDIAQISIQSGTNALHLAKRDNLWRVAERGNYPANFSQISDLLLKLANLKIVQSEEAGPSQLGRFDLLPPGAENNSGTLVEFKDQSGKTLDTLLLGKKHMSRPAANSQSGGMGDEGWPDGRYVMAGSGAKTVAVISDALENVQPQPAQWLNKEFLSIEKPRTISAQFSEATNSWKLTRDSETNDWQLADARPDEKLDSTKISSVTSPFSSVNFNDVAPLDAKTGSATNGTVLTVETFDGFNYVARIGAKKDDDYPVSFSVAATLPTERVMAKDEKPEDKTKLDQAFKDRQKEFASKLAREKQFENWIYFLPGFSVDEILKTRGQLLLETNSNSETSSSQPAQ
jgi:hypothetical protein